MDLGLGGVVGRGDGVVDCSWLMIGSGWSMIGWRSLWGLMVDWSRMMDWLVIGWA